MVNKILIILLVVLFISCNISEEVDKENRKEDEIKINNTFFEKVKKNIHNPHQIDEEIDALVFKGNCFYSKDYTLEKEMILDRYFNHLNILKITIKSFCNDSMQIKYKHIDLIDYLNGKYRILEFEYKDSITSTEVFRLFKNNFILNKQRIENFFFLKPGFILVVKSDKISLILIDDCSERKKYLILKKHVVSHYSHANYLISRCGMNIY